MENWKDIKGFEGLYQVSDLGNVRSLDREISYIQKNQYGEKQAVKRLKGRLLSPRATKGGYLRVQLCNQDYYIHRLVCNNFIRPLKPKEEINHIDGNKKNNRLDNLEIVSRIENQNHAIDNNLSSFGDKAIKVEVDGVVYDSIGQASAATGIPKGTLIKHLDNPNIKPYKYHFTIKRV